MQNPATRAADADQPRVMLRSVRPIGACCTRIPPGTRMNGMLEWPVPRRSGARIHRSCRSGFCEDRRAGRDDEDHRAAKSRPPPPRTTAKIAELTRARKRKGPAADAAGAPDAARPCLGRPDTRRQSPAGRRNSAARRKGTPKTGPPVGHSSMWRTSISVRSEKIQRSASGV